MTIFCRVLKYSLTTQCILKWQNNYFNFHKYYKSATVIWKGKTENTNVTKETSVAMETSIEKLEVLKEGIDHLEESDKLLKESFLLKVPDKWREPFYSGSTSMQVHGQAVNVILAVQLVLTCQNTNGARKVGDGSNQFHTYQKLLDLHPQWLLCTSHDWIRLLFKRIHIIKHSLNLD